MPAPVPAGLVPVAVEQNRADLLAVLDLGLASMDPEDRDGLEGPVLDGEVEQVFGGERLAPCPLLQREAQIVEPVVRAVDDLGADQAIGSFKKLSISAKVVAS